MRNVAQTHIHLIFKKPAFLFIAALYSCGLLYIAYFLERTDTFPLLSTYGFLFLLCLLSYSRAEQYPVAFWIGLAIFLRLLLLGAMPNLSDDFYRFIWDGRLWLAGEHPFTHLPSSYISSGTPLPDGLTEELYHKLNSPHYYTIYPPINQAIFTLSALLSPQSLWGSVFWMRIALLVAERGSLFLIRRILQIQDRSPRLLLLYALNPLVILELTGNLHFEALMIFFVLLSIYIYHRYLNSPQKEWLAGTALALAGAIGSKLIPLLFLPLWFKRLPKSSFSFLLGITLLLSFLLFLPLFNLSFLKGMLSSISLYYLKFEFNAGLYYLLRELGFWLFDNNIIIQAGPVLALLTLSGILWLSLNKKAVKLPLAEAMFWAYAIFLLFSLTVHPWYLTPLVALSLFTPYRFPILWSALVFLTYTSYRQEGFDENLLIVALEYTCVAAYALWEGKKAIERRRETGNVRF